MKTLGLWNLIFLSGVLLPTFVVAQELRELRGRLVTVGARFSVELAIRDLKQHFGLGDYQCYLGIAIDRFAHLACLAYGLFGLLQRQQLKSDWMPQVSTNHSVLSFSRLRRGLQHFATTVS